MFTLSLWPRAGAAREVPLGERRAGVHVRWEAALPTPKAHGRAVFVAGTGYWRLSREVQSAPQFVGRPTIAAGAESLASL